MALAVLALQDSDDADLVFGVDVGTNTHFQLLLGRAAAAGDARTPAAELAEVYHRTAPRRAAPSLFGGDVTERVPRRLLQGRRSQAQLVSWKDGGRARAVSDPVDLSGEAAMATAMSVARSARSVPHRLPPLARPASLDALIGDIVKIASPLVTRLLQQGTAGAEQQAAGSAGAPLQGLMQVLQMLLAGLSAPEPKAAAGGAPQVAKVASLIAAPRRADGSNRFTTGGRHEVAAPFIFGIDDALIASLVGPVLNVLPQLMNAANAKRIEMKKADNLLMAGLVGDLQKRLMLEKLIEAQAAAQAQGPAAPIDADQLQALAGLLAALPSAPEAAKAKSLSVAAGTPRQSPRPSARALVDFELGATVPWAGSDAAVFQRTRRIVLRPRLVVSGDAPKRPLPKALLRLVLRDAEHMDVRVEKTFRLRDVYAQVPIECAFEPAELAPLPAHARISVLAQLRWQQAGSGRETCATGAAEVVLVDDVFVRERGGEVDSERELADMARHRSFWNRVWQAPVLTGGRRRLWELDVQARLTTLLDARHDSNALMQTRLLAAADDGQGLRALTQGRMKAGIELSLAELNRLLPLWPGRTAHASAVLEALAARPVLAGAAREALCRLRLKGRAGQGGMVWLVPVLRLIGFTLSEVAGSDERGQVNATREREIAFPLPVALRTIGLSATT